MSISFVIPTLYNEPYLSASIKSIIKEIENSKTDSEILVMIKDEGNRLPNYLRKMKEEYDYIKCYLVEGNRSDARNEGIKKARNEIIAIVDADTLIGNSFIEKTLEAMKKYGYVNYSARPLITRREDKRRFYYYSKLMNFFQWLFTHLNIYRPYGFCTTFRKSICKEVEFDEKVFDPLIAGFGEDSEFGKRYGRYCRKNKIRGRYLGKVRVYTSFREWYKRGFRGMAERVMINNIFVPLLRRPLIN